MKKIFLLFICCLFFTGCSIEYNVYIEEDVVVENSFFIDEDTIENDNTFDNIAASKQSAFFDMYSATSELYEVTKFDPGEGKLGLNYYYEFYYKDYVNSTLFSECFSDRVFSFNNDQIVLSTNSGINCMYRDDSKRFDELVINISSAYKLIETNADSIDNGVYTWNIDESNFSEKSIILKLDSAILNEDIKEDNFNTIIKYIGIGLLGFVLIFIIVVYIKYKRTS